MSLLRVLPAALAMSMALVACQSFEKRAETDEVKVVKGVEAVCAAQADVEAAMKQVNGLTPDSTVVDAQKAVDKLKAALSALNKAEDQLENSEVKEYRDQVDLFRKAVHEVSKNKKLTLEEVAEQLKGKASPLLTARKQLASKTVCIEAADNSADAKADEKPKS